MPMTSRGRRPHFTLTADTLQAALATASIGTVAQTYHVSYTTVWRRVRTLGLCPPPRGYPRGRPRLRHQGPYGRIPGQGLVEAALVAVMQPGCWYSGPALRVQVPGSRQRLYQLLARLCAEGQLLRRGRSQAYEWCRPPTGARA